MSFLQKFKSGRGIALLSCLFLLLLFFSLFFSMKPKISGIREELYASDALFPAGGGITFFGKNLRYVTDIFLNGKKAPECEIIKASDDALTVFIPPELYSDVETLTVRFRAKAGFLAFRSSAFTITLLSTDAASPVLSPVTKVVWPSRSDTKVIVQAEHLTFPSALYIGDSTADETDMYGSVVKKGILLSDVTYDTDSGRIGFFLPADMTAGRDFVTLQLMYRANENWVSYSNVLTLPVKSDDTDYTVTPPIRMTA